MHGVGHVDALRGEEDDYGANENPKMDLQTQPGRYGVNDSFQQAIPAEYFQEQTLEHPARQQREDQGPAQGGRQHTQAPWKPNVELFTEPACDVSRTCFLRGIISVHSSILERPFAHLAIRDASVLQPLVQTVLMDIANRASAATWEK